MDGGVTTYTLSCVITLLQEHLSLTPTRRRDLVSAVIRVCEIIGLDPKITPASLQAIRPLINKVHPARYDLSQKTWSNLCSNFRAALVHALPRLPRRPDAVWERLRATLPDRRMRKGLSRFIGYCERERIPPEAVCDAVIARFVAFLQSDTLVANPCDCHRRTCRLWNAAVDNVPDWRGAHVGLPVYRRTRRSLPLSAYPANVEDEFRQCVAPPRPGRRFALDGHKRILKASTVRKMKAELELALFAVVETGRDPASITSLKCLFEPNLFKIALSRYCNDDEVETPRATARNIASTVIGLAVRCLGSDVASLPKIAELRRLQRCLGPQPRRMTEKNRRLLRELSDPAVLAKLLLLPERLATWAQHTTPIRGAQAMEFAAAIAILIVAPMRIANLAGLRLDRHLTRPGRPRSPWLIAIPPEEVKNEVPLLYELSQRVTAVVDRFIRNFRALLAAPGNVYLFPVGSTHKSPAAFSQQIRGVIADWVGIDMTPHQFRHLAGMLMQKNSPGSLEALAQLLGHKRIETVLRFYAELNTLAAGRRFDEIVEAEIAKARSPRRWRS
jgi:integrase